MAWPVWFAELRTTLTGIDPGLVRLRLSSIAIASMVLAVGVMAGVSALTGQQVTVVLLAAVLAMISNLAVNEPELRRLRTTTPMMLVPAAVAVTAGTLLAPYRIVADVVFVAVMMAAVYVRRFGPRGNALGMAAVMPYFFTQFLQATAAQLPVLLIAVGVGVSSTLLLRGWVFAEQPARTLDRTVRAFHAHLHGLVEAVADLLEAPPDDLGDELRAVARRRTRLNETALLVADHLEQHHPGRDDRTGPLGMQILDAELAAERLAVATQRLVQGPNPPGEDVRRPLLAGLHAIGAATATGSAPGRVSALLDGAGRSVGALTAETDGLGDRVQRVAFAVTRLATALGTTEGAYREPGDDQPDKPGADLETGTDPEPAAARPGGSSPADDDPDKPAGLPLASRQAVQVGVATSLAIVIGELVSPARWYWAVIAAFVVFAGTSSRGDVLSRGSQRVAGTIGGVIAGMGLAFLVGGSTLPALVLMFGCVFLALYLVHVSPALMAFWITAVLALLYGLLGQFSVQTLVLRIEETAVGAAMGMLAGYLVLPKRTREVFDEGLDDVVDAADAVLAATVDRVLGREPDAPPVELARKMDDALGTLRKRAKPLDNPLPWRRGRSSYQRALRVLTGVDHYARRLARISDVLDEPGWEPTLEPAAARIRGNLDALRRALLRQEAAPIRSAEDVVDAAEAYAARTGDHRLRGELLTVARLLRRIDQAVVGLAVDIGVHDVEPVHRTGADRT